MNKEEFAEKMKDFMARLGKRNLIIITSVLAVAVIAAASWALFPASTDEGLPSGAAEGEDTTVSCHFCGKNYVFTPDEISALANGAIEE